MTKQVYKAGKPVIRGKEHVKSFQLKKEGGWKVRFLDEDGKPMKVLTIWINNRKAESWPTGQEWVNLYHPTFRWSAERMVRRFLSGRIPYSDDPKGFKTYTVEV